MDKIESLIKALTELKEELFKAIPPTQEEVPKVNLNNPYNEQASDKDSKSKKPAKKDESYGKIIIKDPKPQPTDKDAPYGKIIRKEEEMDKASKDPALAPKEVKIKQLQAQIDAGTYKPDPKKIADKMLKEELTCSENGQWNIVEKAIRQPNLDALQFSGADHIKPKKYQGGDPRHANDVMSSTHYRGSGPQRKTGDLRPEVHGDPNTKLKGATSGTSKK